MGFLPMPPKPREGGFLFSPLFVGRSPLQGDAPFGGSFLSAKCRDPIGRNAVSLQGSALGWGVIRSSRISCIGTSAVVTSTHISSTGTSADVTDSRGRPRPTFSSVIAMPAYSTEQLCPSTTGTKSNASCFFRHSSCDCTDGTARRQQRGRLIPALAFHRR